MMQLKTDNRIIAHHVGGRAGSIGFPIPKMFESQIVNIMYEADESCVDQILETHKNRSYKTEVYPLCLSDKNGECDFNLNYDPYTSSIYDFNSEYKNYYSPYKNSGYDYLLGDSIRPIKKLKLKTTTIDNACQEKNISPPDFLSLDTQGSELDILKGSEHCLKNHVLMVLTEVEFVPIYKDQPLFGDVSKYLYQFGFEPVDISINRRHPDRGKIGARGENIITDGDVLFIKKPQYIKDMQEELANIQLHKLIFLSSLYSQFDLVNLCLNHPNFKAAISNHQSIFPRFISDIDQAFKKLQDRNFPIFSHKYSSNESSQRFSVNTGPQSKKQKIKVIIKSIWPLNKLVKLYWLTIRTSNYLKSKINLIADKTKFFTFLTTKQFLNPLEKTLLKYNLSSQCKFLLKNRIFDMRVYKYCNSKPYIKHAEESNTL